MPERKNNENLNIINGIFGNNNNQGIMAGNVVSQNAETERERRLKLREMERLKR